MEGRRDAGPGGRPSVGWRPLGVGVAERRLRVDPETGPRGSGRLTDPEGSRGPLRVPPSRLEGQSTPVTLSEGRGVGWEWPRKQEEEMKSEKEPPAPDTTEGSEPGSRVRRPGRETPVPRGPSFPEVDVYDVVPYGVGPTGVLRVGFGVRRDADALDALPEEIRDRRCSGTGLGVTMHGEVRGGGNERDRRKHLDPNDKSKGFDTCDSGAQKIEDRVQGPGPRDLCKPSLKEVVDSSTRFVCGRVRGRRTKSRFTQPRPIPFPRWLWNDTPGPHFPGWAGVGEGPGGGGIGLSYNSLGGGPRLRKKLLKEF